MTNPAKPTAPKRKDKKAERREIVQDVLLGPRGQEFLDVIDSYCGYGQDVFTPDAMRNAYLMGRQSVAVHLRRLLEGEKPDEPAE